MEQCSLKIESSEGSPPIITASGELDFDSCEDFKRCVDRVIGSNPGTIELDLGDLNFVDSSGLRVLITLGLDAEKAGCSLRITSISSHLKRIMDISGFRHLFKISEYPPIAEPPCSDAKCPLQAVTFVVERGPCACSKVRDKVCEFASGCGFDQLSLDDVRLGIGEAISNAVRHGDAHGNISVRCHAATGVLQITLKYPSSAFEPEEIPIPNMNDHPEGGMGIFFINLVMDDVSYSFEDGHALVKLEKRIGPCPSLSEKKMQTQ